MDGWVCSRFVELDVSREVGPFKVDLVGNELWAKLPMRRGNSPRC